MGLPIVSVDKKKKKKQKKIRINNLKKILKFLISHSPILFMIDLLADDDSSSIMRRKINNIFMHGEWNVNGRT